ncbi:MAG: PAS domain-containing protein [Candidatus Paceibacterota bacterium]|jgi:nitrogen-specific signal transduction histidine kinase
MKNNKIKADEISESKKIALHYMKTLVDVARESFLILDADLRVLSANPIFYESFLVSPKQTENKLIYKLGNGQWNIKKLKGLLEKVLPEKKIIKNYEVTHVFEVVGERTILLNAKQVDQVKLIIIAMEDITERKQLEKKLVNYTQELEIKVSKRTEELARRVKELELINKSMVGRELKMVELKKEIERCNRQLKNGNGNHKNGRQK